MARLATQYSAPAVQSPIAQYATSPLVNRYRSCVDRSNESPSGLMVAHHQRSSQAGQHPSDLGRLPDQSLGHATLQYPEVRTHRKVMFYLTRRSDGNSDKSREVGAGVSRCALGDIRTDGHGRANDLGTQPGHTAIRPTSERLVHCDGQRPRTVPDLELGVILHGACWHNSRTRPSPFCRTCNRGIAKRHCR